MLAFFHRLTDMIFFFNVLKKSKTRGSRFMRYQEARIQELPDQVPIGHIPRAMTVHCRGGLTRACSPGEKKRWVGGIPMV